MKFVLLYILCLLGLIAFLYFQYSNVLEGLETIKSNSTDSNSTDSNSTDSKQYIPYNTSDPNNCFILAQQNAGNIEVLKDQIQDIRDVKPQIDKITENINAMQTQMQQLVQQQADYAQELVGSNPPYITGITDKNDNEDNNEDEI